MAVFRTSNILANYNFPLIAALYFKESKLYSADFIKAIKTTRNLGFPLSRMNIHKTKRYIDDDFLENGINDVFQKTFSTLTANDISEQCVPIHHNVLPAIEKYFGCKAYLTIGSVEDHKNCYFDMSNDYINDTLSRGVTSLFKFHCWITLDSLEIIDATLATTMGVNGGSKSLIGQMLAVHPDNLPNIGSKLIYTPKLIGSSYLENIGINPASGIAVAGHHKYMPPSYFNKFIAGYYSVIDKI